MFDFNNIRHIDDNFVFNGVERQALINSLLTPDNLPKIFKLLYNIDIVISKVHTYIDKDDNNAFMYKITNIKGDLLLKVLSRVKYNFEYIEGYKYCEFNNNHFKITCNYRDNTLACTKYIMYNKEDFDISTLKYILQKI